MGKTAAIMQSNYLPWKGYFDLIRQVDVFVFYDDRQYTKNDWRNRNRIMTAHGPQWISVPCGTDLNRRICDVRINDHRWQKKHHRSIMQAYARAPEIKRLTPMLDALLLERTWLSLSELNQSAITTIATDVLQLSTHFTDVLDLNIDPALNNDRNQRLISVLHAVGARTYLSAPAAQSYMDVQRFLDAGIDVQWMSYEGYPEYDHVHGTFRHDLSIIDVIAHLGDAAINGITPEQDA